MFKTYRDKNGKARWIMTSSNHFRDRDKEIVSGKALAADVERADLDGDYGPLRWWHVKGLDIGDCDFNVMRDGMLIESGTFRSEDIARWAEKNAPDLGVSIGFTHPADEPDKDGVFHNIRRVERSLLPNTSAANPYTNFSVKEAVNLADPKTARKWKTFVTVLFGGDEKAATEYAEQVSATARGLEEKGVSFKEQATEKANQFAQSAFERKIENAVTNGRRVVSVLQTAIGAKDKARLPALLRDANQAFDKLDAIASESRGPGFSGPEDVLQVMDTLEALMRDAERVKEAGDPATEKAADESGLAAEIQAAMKEAGLAVTSGDRARMVNARTDIGLVYVKVVNAKNRVDGRQKWGALEASVRRQMDSLDRALDASWMSGKEAGDPATEKGDGGAINAYRSRMEAIWQQQNAAKQDYSWAKMDQAWKDMDKLLNEIIGAAMSVDKPTAEAYRRLANNEVATRLKLIAQMLDDPSLRLTKGRPRGGWPQKEAGDQATEKGKYDYLPGSQDSPAKDAELMAQCKDAITETERALASGKLADLKAAHNKLGMAYVVTFDHANRRNADGAWSSIRRQMNTLLDRLDRGEQSAFISGKAAKGPQASVDYIISLIEEIKRANADNSRMVQMCDLAIGIVKNREAHGMLSAVGGIASQERQAGDEPTWTEMENAQNIQRLRKAVNDYLKTVKEAGDQAEPTLKEGPATIYHERAYTRVSDTDPLAFIKG